mmetsp:Transcript_11353/g.34601  ORF Transcript_11353/g.34601 Transcript_11353/m.34601 type:complete len:207 (+) Transcript_11353:624-1244(+)
MSCPAAPSCPRLEWATPPWLSAGRWSSSEAGVLRGTHCRTLGSLTLRTSLGNSWPTPPPRARESATPQPSLRGRSTFWAGRGRAPRAPSSYGVTRVTPPGLASTLPTVALSPLRPQRFWQTLAWPAGSRATRPRARAGSSSCSEAATRGRGSYRLAVPAAGGSTALTPMHAPGRRRLLGQIPTLPPRGTALRWETRGSWCSAGGAL